MSNVALPESPARSRRVPARVVRFRCGCMAKLPAKGGRRSLMAVVRPCLDHQAPFDRAFITSQAYSAADAAAVGASRDDGAV